jgi:hypothetical protein
MWVRKSSVENKIEDRAPFERFRKFVKRLISIPKSEIDRRTEEWKSARETNKREESESKE